jgi:Zn-dependent protease with chaperone function
MNQTAELPLEPLPYHRELIRYLEENERDLWKWFSADRLRAEHHDAVRLDLLKSTYRIEREAGPALYAAADEVAERFKVSAPVTFYQTQHAGGLNAGLAYVPGEVHLILTGPVMATLTPVELRCVLGHELFHYLLLDCWREYLTASQLLSAMANDVAAEAPHAATHRLFHLYAEIYCDRGAYLATGDLRATVASLVKIETGTTEVSAESYLRQAEEIFARGLFRAEGVTHPETFIRARAAKLWAEDPATATAGIAAVIEGPLSLDQLDLLGQIRLSALTRRLIAALLRHRWLRTEPVLAHARLFFEDFRPAAGPDPGLRDALQSGEEKLRDYFSYVLLDFAVADRDLEEAPLAAALLLGDELGLGERFRQIAGKELGLRKKSLDSLEARAKKVVAGAAASDEERDEERNEVR